MEEEGPIPVNSSSFFSSITRARALISSSYLSFLVVSSAGLSSNSSVHFRASVCSACYRVDEVSKSVGFNYGFFFNIVISVCPCFFSVILLLFLLFTSAHWF